MYEDIDIRPFAFMRLTHEAIRAGMTDVTTAIQTVQNDPSRDTVGRLRAEVESLFTCIRIHAAVEDKAFFPLLDERFQEAAKKAGFYEDHHTDEDFQNAILDALGGLEDGSDHGAVDGLARALDAWSQRCEAHLVHEEEVMMPLTRLVSDTVEGRAEAVKGMIESVPATDVDDTLVPYVLRKLEHTKFGMVRMFVESLRVSTGLERFSGAIRTNLSAATVAKLEDVGTLS